MGQVFFLLATTSNRPFVVIRGRHFNAISLVGKERSMEREEQQGSSSPLCQTIYGRSVIWEHYGGHRGACETGSYKYGFGPLGADFTLPAPWDHLPFVHLVQLLHGKTTEILHSASLCSSPEAIP